MRSILDEGEACGRAAGHSKNAEDIPSRLDEQIEDEYQIVEIQEHLDTALSEFRNMKMQPYLERALSRREILKA